MKILIELDKGKNDVTNIYRKVLTEKAQAVRIISEDDKILTIEMWFKGEELFRLMVNMIIEINFSKVVMINDSDNEPTQSEKNLGREEENPPKVEEVLVKEVSEELPEVESIPVGNVLEDISKVEQVQEKVPKAEDIPVKGVKIGKGSRKRAGKDLTNLFDIPEFPKELTLENVMKFFDPMSDRIRESLRPVITIALDASKMCSMEWKDIAKVASEMGVHLSDYDKVKYSKQIADIFEKHGYSVRAKGFLQLLRDHVEGNVTSKESAKQIKTAERKVNAVEVLVDIEAFKWLEGLKYDISKKEEIVTRILKSMDVQNKLSLPAQKLLYYITVCASSMKEYSLVSVDLLLGDIQIQRTSELTKEIDNFVKEFMRPLGVTCSHGYLMKLISEYFRDVFTEKDAEFVHKIRPFEEIFEVAASEPERVNRFAIISYHQGIEDLFSKLWDEGHGLGEILIELFAYMAEENLSADECKYLEVCAERVAFDSLNDIYLDLGKNQLETRMIQTSLSEKLTNFIDKNKFKAVKLYDFISDVREIFEREA